MKIDLTLTVDDDSLIDKTHPMGITNTAYDELFDTLTEIGYEITEGPSQAES